MDICITVSKDFPKIAKEEADALIKKRTKWKDHFLFVNTTPKNIAILEKRAAFVKKISKVLFSCYADHLDEHLKSYDWNKEYKKDFAVRVIGKEPEKERQIADIIWTKLKRPKVNLDSPKTTFEFIFIKKYVIATRRLTEIKRHFKERAAHKRPGFSPVSMDPKIARAMVNLSGVKGKEKIIDPFCGTGGILIEAGLMNMAAEGIDIDDQMVGFTKANLKHFNIRKIKIETGDALTIKSKAFAFVTDPPYGKNTKKVSIIPFYTTFLKNAEKCTNIVIMCVPSTLDKRKVLKKTKWKIRKEFTIPIHSSLTRRLIILQK